MLSTRNSWAVTHSGAPGEEECRDILADVSVDSLGTVIAGVLVYVNICSSSSVEFNSANLKYK